MTPALMSPEVRAELAGLQRKTKAELRAWLSNKLQIVIGANSTDAENTKLPPLVRQQARLRNRIMSEFQNEIETLLNPNQLQSPSTTQEHNSHLGATESA